MYQKYMTQIADEHVIANEEKEKGITSLKKTIKRYQDVDAHVKRINVVRKLIAIILLGLSQKQRSRMKT